MLFEKDVMSISFSVNVDRKIRTLTVPDYPYTRKFTQEGIWARVAIVPLEYPGAHGDILRFIKSIPKHCLRNGIDWMKISHDEDGLLAVWKDVHLLPYSNEFGMGLEIECLSRDVRYL